jgi:hypothetical protein
VFPPFFGVQEMPDGQATADADVTGSFAAGFGGAPVGCCATAVEIRRAPPKNDRSRKTFMDIPFSFGPSTAA